MSDEIDRANDRVLMDTDLAIRNCLKGQTLPPQHVVDEVVVCLDCDNELPKNRLEALPLCIRCIRCQTVYERLKK